MARDSSVGQVGWVQRGIRVRIRQDEDSYSKKLEPKLCRTV